jgi:hypothetical protein
MRTPGRRTPYRYPPGDERADLLHAPRSHRGVPVHDGEPAVNTQTAIATQPSITDESALVHLACCDLDVAMCGEDLTDAETVYGDEAGPPCLLCLYVYDEGLPCPVPGCVGWDDSR